MSEPLIGVTTHRIGGQKVQGDDFATPLSYLNAVNAAGGIPLLIPANLDAERLRRLMTRLDGLLLTGGGDIDPARFDGPAHPAVYGIEPERDEAETALVHLAVEYGLPFLGICRGIQLVNVALGGGLYTHLTDQLPGALKHDCFPDYPRNHIAHSVRLAPTGRLEGILGGETFSVNSMHHQGVWRIAPGLEATAWAPDGLVEGLELPGHPFGLAVQWHPEWLQEHEPQRALFRAFIEACAG